MSIINIPDLLSIIIDYADYLDMYKIKLQNDYPTAMKLSYNKSIKIIVRFGDKLYIINNKIHREDGPALEYANGDKIYYINNQISRINEPAVVYRDGSTKWYLNDLLHRTNGPAVEYAYGLKQWYRFGLLHREDGPAVIHSGRDEFYFLNNKLYSKIDWKAKVSKNNCLLS